MAYSGVQFRPRSRNGWAWLQGTPAEGVHGEHETVWRATLLPDTLYMRGKRREQRIPARPEVSLCRACLREVMARDPRAYSGRVVAFEPDADVFTQCFFVAAPDFEQAGLAPGVHALHANGRRLCFLAHRSQTWTRQNRWTLLQGSASVQHMALGRSAKRLSPSPKPMCLV